MQMAASQLSEHEQQYLQKYLSYKINFSLFLVEVNNDPKADFVSYEILSKTISYVTCFPLDYFLISVSS